MTIDGSTPESARKGVCLVLWRMGYGKIGKTVKASAKEIQWQLNAIGIRASLAAVQTAITANVKSSWVERVRRIDAESETFEYKLTAEMGTRAAEIAARIGTDLLPKAPDFDTEEMAEEVAAIFGGEVMKDDMQAEPKTPTDTQALIDGFLNILTLASDAHNAKERADAAEKAAQIPEEAREAIGAAIDILSKLADLSSDPLGMLLNQKCGEEKPQITERAWKTAQELCRHFSGKG